MEFKLNGSYKRLLCPMCNFVINEDNIDHSMSSNEKAFLFCGKCSYSSIFVIDFDFCNGIQSREDFELKVENDETFELAFINRIANGAALNRYRKKKFPKRHIYDDMKQIINNKELCKEFIENYGEVVNDYNITSVLTRIPKYDISVDGQYSFIEITNKHNETEYVFYIGN